MRVCSTCKQNLNEEMFYPRKGKGYPQSKCRSCFSNMMTLRRVSFKKLCINYLGGKCSICGYSTNLAALEFHHTTPENKKFSISSIMRYSSLEEVIPELDKCILLCANCHRDVEYPIWRTAIVL